MLQNDIFQYDVGPSFWIQKLNFCTVGLFVITVTVWFKISSKSELIPLR